MTRRLILLALLVAPSGTFAQTVIFPIEWDPPTQFTDGTPVAPGDIEGYLVCVDTASIPTDVPGCGTGTEYIITDGDATTYQVVHDPGIVTGVLYVRVRAVDVAGFQGQFSVGEIARPFLVSRPPPQPGSAVLGPPGNLRQ